MTVMERGEADGYSSFPPEFKCKIEPRSKHALSLLEDSAANAD